MKAETTTPVSATFSVTRGRNEKATYNETPNPRYGNNPLIEALPAIMSEETITGALGYFPPFDASHRKLPAEERIHMVHTVLDLFVPLPEHIDLAERISCLVREGYTARNPLAQDYWQTFRARTAADAAAPPQLRVRSSARGMTVIGVSGGGKTTAMEAVLNLYPQVIQHTEYRQRPFTSTQIVWLKLQCPFDGSTRGLCLNFFQTIDELIGTNHYRNYGHGRRSTDELMPAMKRVAMLHSIGVLVVDEIQHLSQAKSGGTERMLNFFCQLVNMIGVPVIYIGTPKAVSVLGSEFRQTRRGTSEGDFIWDRLEQSSDAWTFLLECLGDYQYVEKPTVITPEISAALYDETQGIVDLAVKLFMLTQVRAIKARTEVLTAETIRSVAKDSFRTVKPALDALRSGDFEKINQIGDLKPVDYHAEFRRITREARIAAIKSHARPPAPLPELASPQPREQPAPPSRPRVTVQVSLEQSTATNVVEIGKRAKEANMSAHDALAVAGFIQEPGEFLNTL